MTQKSKQRNYLETPLKSSEMVGINMDGPARDRVMKLIQDKDRIEGEIREQTAILETNNVGMDDPLVDAEGFPRNDIDVYKVRHARHRIICKCSTYTYLSFNNIH